MNKFHRNRDPRYKLLPAAFSNDDGTAYVEYVGDVKKVGNLDMSIFQDITAALDKFTCTVTREGDEYIIHLDKQEEA